MFEDKDQALRDDVRTLGAMVGDLIRDQGGEELFEFVENARLRSIRRREDNERPGEELAKLVRTLEPDMAQQVIRSFSTYFQMVNTAEKVHRIRRRREYLQEVGHYQPGGFEDTLVKLKAASVDGRGPAGTAQARCASSPCSPRTRPSRRAARCCARNRISYDTWSTC